MSNILVTGFQGFIGNALCKKLKQNKNNRVIGLGFDSHIDRETNADDVIYGDIRDGNLCNRVIGDYEVDTVYHLAAQSIVRICANDPVNAYDINVMGTARLLEACRTIGATRIKNVIVSTSDKAFGHSPSPYTERTPLQPRYTYEATKSCQDLLAQNYFYNYGVPVKICRCSNVYGPGDPNTSRLIPNSILKILHGEAPWIYSDVAEYVREFIYIDDVVNAFELVAERSVPGEIYCVGGTGAAKVKYLVETLLTLCQSSLEIQFIDKPAVFKEIQNQYIDATKLLSLGWRAGTNLLCGLSNTIEWYRNGK